MWRWANRGRRDGAEAASVTTEEVLRRVRSWELRTRAWVDSLLAGDHASRFVGQGFDFSHVRGYVPGDDVRAIDWRATARTGVPFVRRFVEERDLLVTVVVDRSASVRRAPGARSGDAFVEEIVAGLAFAAARNNDRLALLLVTDRIEAEVPAASGRRQALRVLSKLLSHRPRGAGTDLTPALEALARSRRGRSLVFLVGDLVQEPEAPFRRALGRAARAHDLIAIRTEDPDSGALPELGWVALTDPEAGGRSLVATGRRAVRAGWRERWQLDRDRVNRAFLEAGAEVVEVGGAEDPLGILAARFRLRQGRAAR